MSQRCLYNNANKIFRPSRSISCSTTTPTTSSHHQLYTRSSGGSRTASTVALGQATCLKDRPKLSTRHSTRQFTTSSPAHGWAPARRLDRAHPEPITDATGVTEYLRKTFPPLDFPEDVALRVITHASWKGGAEGHNTRLSFIGRRVIECYFNLFLHSRTNSGLSAPHLSHRMDYEELAAKILDTHVLGEYVGGAWKLEQVMRWVPSHTNDPSRTLWSSGLYRVRGTTVEAIMGGVFHQFGGLTAHRLFHTRFLPHISAASVLPLSDSMREAVIEACDAYGGAGAPLIRPTDSQSPKGDDGPIPPVQRTRMPVGEFGFTGAKKRAPSGPPRLRASPPAKEDSNRSDTS